MYRHGQAHILEKDKLYRESPAKTGVWIKEQEFWRKIKNYWFNYIGYTITTTWRLD